MDGQHSWSLFRRHRRQVVKGELERDLPSRYSAHCLRPQALVRSSSSFFSLAMSHPFVTFFAVVSSWVGLALLLQKIFAPSHGSGANASYKADEFVKKD